MRQYTTPAQTVKLIELGFEKPSSIASVEPIYGMGGISVAKAYSIGELLSFLPLSLENDDYYILTIRGSKVMYCDPYLDWIEAEWVKHEELIDNLFDACVELKGEEVI